ncbi:ribonuclease P protein component [Candidatus Leptofilum sp.]|uniref:ribonuclease P protein component n=1 Tax=Candidatus Leptofilum sp. TaxID=3241576 RepID=UPI003B58FF1B
MLPQPHRLSRSADVARVRQQGRTFRHPLCILLVKSAETGVSRFAFIASKRVGKAVVRNRARRLLREAVRLHLGSIQPGWDCVWIARPHLPSASFAEVETAVLQLLTQAKLITDIARTETLD